MFIIVKIWNKNILKLRNLLKYWTKLIKLNLAILIQLRINLILTRFLFPELLQDGKINLNKTISYKGIIFHLLFKIITILIIYLKYKLFITNSILFLILGITSFDFWVVKNYSGKKLIGVTWITFRDDNSDLWYFERINKLYP